MGKKKYLVFSNDVAPVHPGVYQREGWDGESLKKGKYKQVWYWSKWYRNKWYCLYEDFYAAKASIRRSFYQPEEMCYTSTLRWRGLAEKPE